VVVAPHPDDEVIAVGGLLARLARHRVPVRVIAVTDGTASHPESTQWPVGRLASARPQESRHALQRLGCTGEPIRLGFPDGAVADMYPMMVERLSRLLARSDVVFTTWRRDGHPDHEATGHACAFAAASTGARLVEVPVWAWHWAAPGDTRLPWHRAHRLALDDQSLRRKCEAMRCFRSQSESDPTTGGKPILCATTLERTRRPFEVMFT
jgi:LmbE family N-acetylglucosaminyl deacetylase